MIEKIVKFSLAGLALTLLILLIITKYKLHTLAGINTDLNIKLSNIQIELSESKVLIEKMKQEANMNRELLDRYKKNRERVFGKPTN